MIQYVDELTTTCSIQDGTFKDKERRFVFFLEKKKKRNKKPKLKQKALEVKGSHRKKETKRHRTCTMKDDKEVARMAQAAAADALRNDTLKKRQEAMKFQAVKQGASYEEFKSLVKVKLSSAKL